MTVPLAVLYCRAPRAPVDRLATRARAGSYVRSNQGRMGPTGRRTGRWRGARDASGRARAYAYIELVDCGSLEVAHHPIATRQQTSRQVRVLPAPGPQAKEIGEPARSESTLLRLAGGRLWERLAHYCSCIFVTHS